MILSADIYFDCCRRRLLEGYFFFFDCFAVSLCFSFYRRHDMMPPQDAAAAVILPFSPSSPMDFYFALPTHMSRRGVPFAARCCLMLITPAPDAFMPCHDDAARAFVYAPA